MRLVTRCIGCGLRPIKDIICRDVDESNTTRSSRLCEKMRGKAIDREGLPCSLDRLAEIDRRIGCRVDDVVRLERCDHRIDPRWIRDIELLTRVWIDLVERITSKVPKYIMGEHPASSEEYYFLRSHRERMSKYRELMGVIERRLPRRKMRRSESLGSLRISERRNGVSRWLIYSTSRASHLGASGSDFGS